MEALLKVIWGVFREFVKIIFVLGLVAFCLGILVWVVGFAYNMGHSAMLYLFT